MVAGIELGNEYAQICVKTEAMKDAESVTKIAGEEHYRIPIKVNFEQKEEVQELFHNLWKMLKVYADKEPLEELVFCLDQNSEQIRQMLLEIVQIYNISPEKVHFIDKRESFCAYVFHQSAELSVHNVLLIENRKGEKQKLLLKKRTRTAPVVAEVVEASEKEPDQILAGQAVSSVFLVGDDFEEKWMQDYLKLLKSGRRVFQGKNLFVKGACYAGIDWKEKREPYLYLGEDKVSCHIALKVRKNDKEEFHVIAEGGRNWYESDTSLEVFLMDKPELEFAIIPINGRERKMVVIPLEGLPERPEKTTRLLIELTFTSSTAVKLTVKDLGFGEFFPKSDMSYEGELKWEQ